MVHIETKCPKCGRDLEHCDDYGHDFYYCPDCNDTAYNEDGEIIGVIE